MLFRLIRRSAALALLVVSLVCVLWGAWPLPVEQRSLAISSTDLGLPAGPGWLARLSWPGHLRTGDLAELRLAIEPETPALAGGPSSAGTASRAAAPGGRLEARLELTGMPVSPEGEVSQALRLEAPTVFAWRVRPGQAGRYTATVWLHWAASTPAGRRVLGALPVEWQAGSLFGLSGPWARALGAAGVVIGMVFGLDGVAEQVWKRYRGKVFR